MRLPDFRKAPKRPDCAELLSQFVSLGLNCEFGLVQRHCDAEPISLLRFAFTPLHGLITALDCRFEGIGDPDQLSVRILPNGEYMVTHERFSLDFHTQLKEATIAQADMLAKVSRHFTYMAGMLLDDLADAAKIFVHRPQHRDAPLSKAHRLHARMHRIGPATLLWAGYSEDPALIGTVNWLTPGQIMIGYLDHYSPHRYAADASFDVWLSICKAAAALHAEHREITA